MSDKFPVPSSLEKDQIPKKEGDPTPPLREDQIPIGSKLDNLPPRTTGEQDRTTASHREINLIWESTQRKIALVLVYTVTTVSAVLSLSALVPGASIQMLAIATSAFMLLNSLVSMVIGYYFGRTNHERVGGVGVTDIERKEGR